MIILPYKTINSIRKIKKISFLKDILSIKLKNKCKYFQNDNNLSQKIKNNY